MGNGRSGPLKPPFIPARRAPAILPRMKASNEAPATHYRLSDEVKALAVEEYLNGATAKDVAAKWKTSAGSVYRGAREAQPGGKRAVGDARARAHARLVEEEEGSRIAVGEARELGEDQVQDQRLLFAGGAL